MVQRKLGRGLDFLLSGSPGAGAEEVLALDVEAVRPNPFQPRREFSESELAELAASIREHGVLQPVIVRASGDVYQLVAGERRLRASMANGLRTIPAIVRDVDDTQMLELALIENVQRSDLNPMELAQAYRSYVQRLDLTQEAVADRLGKSRSSVANTLRLLDLPMDLQEFVSRGTLTAGHARALLGLHDVEAQRRLADRVVAEGLSVRAVEREVQDAAAAAAGSATASPRRARAAHLGDLEGQLRERLGTRVRVEDRDGRGRIVIEYFTPEELSRLVDQLLSGVGTAAR